MTLTVTLAGKSTYAAAVDVVDVTGVGPSPLDLLGSPTTSGMAGQTNKTFDNQIAANANDLVLAGVGSHNFGRWSASGVDMLIDSQNALATGVRMTAADFQFTATGAGNVWMNGTSNITISEWVGDSLTLKPAKPVPQYAVTFSESGLKTGTTWSVNLGGAVNSSSTTAIGFSEPNGTYSYSIGAVSGYTASPSSGSVTVSGAAPPPIPITFTVATTNGETDDWPTYLGEVARDSAQSGEAVLSSANASKLAPLWNYTIGVANPGYLQAEPVEVNNTVYVGGGNGIFYALNATTGAPVWQSPNLGTDSRCSYPDGITSSATVAGGEVYVGGGDGNFYALNQSTGNVDWKYLVGNPTKGYYNWASPLVLTSLGYVYIGVASDCDHPLVNGGLDQVSLSTHKLVHFFSDLNTSEQAECALNNKDPNGCGGSIWGSPSYDAATNTVWAATGNGYNLSVPEYGDSLMEWNATTLALINHWTIPNAEQETDGDFGATPTLVNPPGGTPMVFATDKNGWSYAFNRANIGAGPIWQTRISSSRDTVAPDAYGGGRIYIAGHATSVSGTRTNGSIRAFNPAVNKSLWADALPGAVLGAPVYANGVVVVAGGDLLEVLNSTTGKVLFSYTAAGSAPFLAAPSIARGVIYVENSNGLVLAFGLPSGSGGHATSGAPGQPPTVSAAPIHVSLAGVDSLRASPAIARGIRRG